MKKYFSIIAIAIGFASYGQQVPQNLTVAAKQTQFDDTALKPAIVPSLSYYSKNYDKVFNMANYTFDSTDYGSRKFFVGYDTTLFADVAKYVILNMPFPGPNQCGYYEQPNCPIRPVGVTVR